VSALTRARDLFHRTFSSSLEGIVSAPGRVNLIGDHTDYTGGFVLPAALRLETAIAYCQTRGEVRAASEKVGRVRFTPGEEGVTGWGAYLAGVAWALAEAGHKPGGLELTVSSDVPVGAGLSSSAALEVAIARVWRGTEELELDDMNLAKLCQQAENAYVGVPSGLMDQFASSVLEPGQAALLDCADLSFERLRVPDAWQFVVVDSQANRSLAESGYEVRVQQCADIARQRHLSSLRELHLQDLEHLEGTLKRRARHVYSENQRVREAAQAMTAGDIALFGRLMNASHASLQGDYEVSSAPLNHLVEASLAFAGCYGSRLTGAGFGGCTVSLLEAGAKEAFTEHLAATVPTAKVLATV
jgi:galactokinase